METKELLTYLNKPEMLRGDTVKELESLAGRYPYFSLTQCLLAMAYQNEDDDRYDGQLKKAACIIADRNNLRLLSLLLGDKTGRTGTRTGTRRDLLL